MDKACNIGELRRGRTFAAQELILNDPQVTAAWPAKALFKERKRLARERRRLFGGTTQSSTRPDTAVAGEACSHPWAAAVWEEGAEYPPGRAETGMVTCKVCRTPTPPQCVGSSGACDDCRLGAMSPEEACMVPGSPVVIVVGRDVESFEGGLSVTGRRALR